MREKVEAGDTGIRPCSASRPPAVERGNPQADQIYDRLSHACGLVAYPLAGWGGAVLGLAATAALLAIGAAAAVLLAGSVWTADHTETVAHFRADLPSHHPHLAGSQDGGRHAHPFVINDLHPRWPARHGPCARYGGAGGA